MTDMLADFTQSLPVWLQWAGIMLAAAIPFVESHFAALIGVVAGIPLPLAVLAASAGNIASVTVFVFGAHAARRGVIARRAGSGSEIDVADEPRVSSAKRARLRRLFDRFGVPGVGLIGQMIVPNQITAAMLISFGAPRGRVMAWVSAGAVLWAIVFALLAQAGVVLLG
jgi:hypothetical protein